MSEVKGTGFYVSDDTKGGVTLMFWPRGMSGGLSVTTGLTPKEALKLATDLQTIVAKLPRVAEASDLGLVA